MRRARRLRAAALVTLLAAWLAAGDGHEARAQARIEPGTASPPRIDPAAIPLPDTTPRTSVEQRIEHGFVGDLSRPAPPAVHRIEGIRIPGAVPPPPAAAATGGRVSAADAPPQPSGVAPGGAGPGNAAKTEPAPAAAAPAGQPAQ